MSEGEKTAVLASDPQTRCWAEQFVPRSHVVSTPTARRAVQCKRLFVLARATRMASTVPAITCLRDRMRVLFMYAEVRPEWIPEILFQSKLRSLRNVVVHFEGDPVVGRVLRAWNTNAQDELIADATVVGDRLELRSCAMNRLNIPFDAIPVLSRIARESRPDFEIDHDGVRITWPGYDVDLGLDALAAAVDPQADARMKEQALLRDRRLGAAIAEVRDRRGLTQSQIPGVTERQIRRIEKGESRPRIATLELLAEAHRLSLSEYLDEIARAATFKARRSPGGGPVSRRDEDARRIRGSRTRR